MTPNFIMKEHPSNYKLIGAYQQSALHGKYKLYRLPKNREIPLGFNLIEHWMGSSVYQENGLLKPKFWALPRYNESPT